MKKFCFLLCPLIIAFFLGGFIVSFKCHASDFALPMPTTATIETASLSTEFLSSLMFTDSNIVPITDNLSGFNGAVNFGAVLFSDLWQWDQNDFTVSELSVLDRVNLERAYSIYNDTGIQLTDDEPIYFVEFDNGFFHGTGYIDENGNLLYSSSDLGGQLLSVAIGGSAMDADSFLNNLTDLADNVIDNNLYLVPNGYNMTERSYYLYYGRTANRNKVEGWIYVSDMYNRGVTVGSGLTNGRSISNFYTNDLSTIVINNINTSYQTPFTVTSGNYTVDGYNYRYKVEMNGVVYSNNSSDYNAFESSTSGYTSYNFSGATFQYDTDLFSANNDILSFKALEYPGTKVVSDPYASYAIDDLSTTYDDVMSIANTSNAVFDPSLGISVVNYPYFVVVPDSITLATADIVQPIERPISDPAVDPSISTPYPGIIPGDITDNIPIISGLQNKFPFSIPWDIYNLIHGLAVPRETPVFHFSINLPVINYTWETDIDLTMYENTAVLFRTTFLILFIIGLALFSYAHFFGS